MKKALSFMFSFCFLFGSGCSLNPNDPDGDTINTSDPLYDKIDRGIGKVISAQTGSKEYNVGSGYFFDIDTTNNHLYLFTNAHVVMNIDRETDHIIVEPVNYHLDTTLPRLCGKIVFLEYDPDVNNTSSKNVDLAVIKLTGEAPAPEEKKVLPDCEQQTNYDFVSNRNLFEIFNALETEYDFNNLKQQNQYLSVGFPLGEYKRMLYTDLIANISSRFPSDSNKYIWDYDQLIFKGKAIKGASGSLIVNKDLKVIGTLAFGYNNSDTQESYVGSVSYKATNWYIMDLCKDSQFTNLSNCV